MECGTTEWYLVREEKGEQGRKDKRKEGKKKEGAMTIIHRAKDTLEFGTYVEEHATSPTFD